MKPFDVTKNQSKGIGWFNEPPGTKRLKMLNDRVTSLVQEMKPFYLKGQMYEDYFQFRRGKNKSIEQSYNLETNPRFTYNAIQACIETAHSKITKTRPKVTFLTKGANREKTSMAEEMDRFVLKRFKKMNLYQKAPKVFLDGCVSGLGIAKIYVDEKKFRHIYWQNFFCAEPYSGSNKFMEAGEKMIFPLWKVIEMFPKKEMEIMKHHGAEEEVMIYEIYMKKKKQAIFTEKVELEFKDWKYPFTPYLSLSWLTPTSGKLGVGLAEKLYPTQTLITYMLGKVVQSIKLVAVPRILVPKGSKMKVTNKVAQLIEYEGGGDKQVPIPLAMPVVHPQYFQQLEELWRKCFEVTGVNQMASHGQVPAGMGNASGHALRTYQRIETERFTDIRRNYEDFFIKCAKMLLYVCKETGDKLPDKVKGKDYEELMEDITIWTSNLLPETPAGRMAMIGELINTGFVNRDEAIELLGSQDLKSFQSSVISQNTAIEMLIHRALEKGEMPPYKPSLGLEEYLNKARIIYSKLLIDNKKEDMKKIERMEAFLKILEQKSAEAIKASTQAAQMQGQPPGPQGGQPSNLGGMYGVT